MHSSLRKVNIPAEISGVKDVRDSKILHTEFFKVQCIIIQAILSRKSMKKNYSYR